MGQVVLSHHHVPYYHLLSYLLPARREQGFKHRHGPRPLWLHGDETPREWMSHQNLPLPFHLRHHMPHVWLMDGRHFTPNPNLALPPPDEPRPSSRVPRPSSMVPRAGDPLHHKKLAGKVAERPGIMAERSGRQSLRHRARSSYRLLRGRCHLLGTGLHAGRSPTSRSILWRIP